MCFIQWCNDNSGFISAILSLVGLVLSVTAIVVSIQTARLPYKKKIMLASSVLLGANVFPGVSTESFVIGISASATNIGNRTISLTYLGYAIKKDGKFHMIYPINREFDCKSTLAPSEMGETQFNTDELLKCFSNISQDTKLYVFAKDTEGKEYKCKSGTVGKLLKTLSK